MDLRVGDTVFIDPHLKAGWYHGQGFYVTPDQAELAACYAHIASVPDEEQHYYTLDLDHGAYVWSPDMLEREIPTGSSVLLRCDPMLFRFVRRETLDAYNLFAGQTGIVEQCEPNPLHYSTGGFDVTVRFSECETMIFPSLTLTVLAGPEDNVAPVAAEDLASILFS